LDDTLPNDIKKITLTTEQFNAKHPVEYATDLMRNRTDYLQHITSPNELMLFNLPESVTKARILELCKVKGVQVLKAALTRSLNEQEREAFAYVKVGDPAQVKILKERFRNVWMEDRKVKLKTREELGYECFDHRTVIVRNIPINYQKKNLVKAF
jgi:hypothetical protein